MKCRSACIQSPKTISYIKCCLYWSLWCACLGVNIVCEKSLAKTSSLKHYHLNVLPSHLYYLLQLQQKAHLDVWLIKQQTGDKVLRLMEKFSMSAQWFLGWRHSRPPCMGSHQQPFTACLWRFHYSVLVKHKECPCQQNFWGNFGFA